MKTVFGTQEQLFQAWLDQASTYGETVNKQLYFKGTLLISHTQELGTVYKKNGMISALLSNAYSVKEEEDSKEKDKGEKGKKGQRDHKKKLTAFLEERNIHFEEVDDCKDPMTRFRAVETSTKYTLEYLMSLRIEYYESRLSGALYNDVKEYNDYAANYGLEKIELGREFLRKEAKKLLQKQSFYYIPIGSEEKLKYKLAKDPNTDPEMLDLLLEVYDDALSGLVMENPNVSIEAIKNKLYRSSDLIKHVLRNPAFNLALMEDPGSSLVQMFEIFGNQE